MKDTNDNTIGIFAGIFNIDYRLKAINAIDIMINKNYSMNLTMLTGGICRGI